jgi:hypothetical protein
VSAHDAAIKPCPGCGEPRGGRYPRGGQLVCWPCSGLKFDTARRPAEPDWVAFRKRIIAALDRVDASRFAYINDDRIVHVCPACRAGLPEYLAVTFHGKTPRAELRCSSGCAEPAIARAIGRLTSRRRSRST